MTKVDLSEKYISILCSQKNENHEVEGNLMSMLKQCLESESGNWKSIVCGHVDHFHSTWDAGWGCGWRNIQMLSSYLLKERQQEVGDLLYGGPGFVPNIESLQKWLELAWQKGFDTEGAGDFDQNICGKKNWIGTTECATLFRSFGLRARIVDFASKDSELGHKRSSISSSENDSGQKVLADWVWNYFSLNNSMVPNENSVIVSKKGPLYFQHDGHSRTIVGIQVKQQRNGGNQCNLLIFDPSSKTSDLARALRHNSGWQGIIKRGIQTLKKPQYQLCYIDPGVAEERELETLKTLSSIRQEF